MEGKYFVFNENTIEHKHTQVVFYLSNKKKLVFEDTRKFGRMELCLTSELVNHKSLSKIGPEAHMTDYKYLISKLNKKTIAIKSALLDQTIIAGLGNIYVNEVLFLSKINPERAANTITINEAKKIIKFSDAVLSKSTEMGGTTISSFHGGDSEGSYQDLLVVHGKKGVLCINCKMPILKIKVNGRGTYYCAKCQK